jgi:uncharacterized RDD family membrane protein YckC
VEVRCHLCQATNPPGAGWCNQCGVRFEPVAVGQPAALPGGPAPSLPAPPFAGPPAPAPPTPVSPTPAPPLPGPPSLPGPARPATGRPGPGPWAPPPPELAGVWSRVGARLLDAVLVGLAVGVVGGLLGLPDTAGLLLTVAAMIGYETFMVANGGQTLGKLLLGLRVVRADLAPPTSRDALVRSLVIDLIWVVPAGWLIVALVLERHRHRQGWHDRAAGTPVVTTRG